MDYLKIGVIAGCLLALWKVGDTIYVAGQNSIQTEWNQAKADHANALLAKEAMHRATEKQWAKAVTSVSDWHTTEQARVRDDYETTIAGIIDGTLVLRERFRGCQQQLSRAGSATGSADGGGGGGLSADDQGFLVRIGQRCDEIATRLTGLQKYVRGTQ